MKAWYSSISLPLNCTLKHINSPNRITTNYPNYLHIYVEYNSTTRAENMVHLNFTTIRLLHETHVQHKYEKNKHNDATMNCNETTPQITNNQPYQKKTRTTNTRTMTIENTNTGSTQKPRHDLLQASNNDQSHRSSTTILCTITVLLVFRNENPS
jgi:hypothetical protein